MYFQQFEHFLSLCLLVIWNFPTSGQLQIGNLIFGCRERVVSPLIKFLCSSHKSCSNGTLWVYGACAVARVCSVHTHTPVHSSVWRANAYWWMRARDVCDPTPSRWAIWLSCIIRQKSRLSSKRRRQLMQLRQTHGCSGSHFLILPLGSGNQSME